MPGFLSHGLRLIDDVLQTVFQAECAGCARVGVTLREGLCPMCRTWFFLRGTLCVRCGTPLSQDTGACGECARHPRSAIRAARSLLWLTESTRTVIHRIKYARRFEYLSVFHEPITKGFRPFYDGAPLVVPVPVHPGRLVRRSFNQAELLGEYVARQASLDFEPDALVKRVASAPQSSLSARERRRNLRRSFAWRAKGIPPSILLIDDIYTTGATLQACARTLRQAGAHEIYAWTLLRTPISL